MGFVRQGKALFKVKQSFIWQRRNFAVRQNAWVRLLLPDDKICSPGRVARARRALMKKKRW